MHFEFIFRIVFANRKRTLRKDEIVSKRFVLSENSYFFGPLHCGKTRERYKEGRYPENMETVTVSNVSMMETNVSFYFQRDHNATTFLLDPPDMTLQPGESKVLLFLAFYCILKSTCQAPTHAHNNSHVTVLLDDLYIKIR